MLQWNGRNELALLSQERARQWRRANFRPYEVLCHERHCNGLAIALDDQDRPICQAHGQTS